MQKYKYKSFTIFGFLFFFGLAGRRTLWIDRNNALRVRRDYLISITRSFWRNERIYFYSIIIGRLTIKFARIKNK